MNNIGQPTVSMPVSHEDARCTTRTDYDTSYQTDFSNRPVNIMEKVTPKCGGVELHSNNDVLNARAWFVEKHINFARVVAHVGKKMVGAMQESASDTVTNLTHYLLDGFCDLNYEHSWIPADAKVTTVYADTMLTMLHMLTSLRNIEGTESDWKEHLECISKGKSNPRWPKNPLLAKFCDEAFKCEALLDKLKALTDKNPDKLKPADFKKMCDLKIELNKSIGELYLETLDNLERITGYTTAELLNQAYSIELEYFTEESSDKPENEREVRLMTVAEGHGFPERYKVEEALRGNLAPLVPEMIDALRDQSSMDDDMQFISDRSLYDMMHTSLQAAGCQVVMPESVNLSDIHKMRQNRIISDSGDSGIASNRSDSNSSIDADSYDESTTKFDLSSLDGSVSDFESEGED